MPWTLLAVPHQQMLQAGAPHWDSRAHLLDVGDPDAQPEVSGCPCIQPNRRPPEEAEKPHTNTAKYHDNMNDQPADKTAPPTLPTLTLRCGVEGVRLQSPHVAEVTRYPNAAPAFKTASSRSGVQSKPVPHSAHPHCGSRGSARRPQSKRPLLPKRFLPPRGSCKLPTQSPEMPHCSACPPLHAASLQTQQVALLSHSPVGPCDDFHRRRNVAWPSRG